MIVSTPRGRYRMANFGGADVIPTPSNEGARGSWSSAGRRVRPEEAVGLPPILAGLRLLAETSASMPLLTYRRVGANKTVVPTAWQTEFFLNQPNELMTPFGLKAFMIAAMVGHGNFVAQKAVAKSGRIKGQVVGIYPFDPRRVVIFRRDGKLIYRVWDNGKVTDLERSQVLHIPGLLLDDPHIGVSPISIATNSVGGALGAEEYANKFFANDATPAGIIEFPSNADSQQAKDAKEMWDDSGKGSAKAHKTRTLFGGATYRQIGVNAQDAQIIESQRWGVEQSARILRLPNWALGGVDQNPRSTPEERGHDLLAYSIVPWLVRCSEGLHADDDLYPDKSLFPGFMAEGLMMADLAARFEAWKVAREGGWMSINDIRAKEGEQPIDNGDDYQVTPVGGAPNLQPGQADQGDLPEA